MKSRKNVSPETEMLKDVLADLERLEAEALMLGDERRAKLLKLLNDWSSFIFLGWTEARLLLVKEKLHRTRLSIDPSVFSEREKLQIEIRELEKSLLWDRRVKALVQFLLLAVCACGTMLIAFEGCLLEPIGLSCVFACWGVTAMVIWCLRDHR